MVELASWQDRFEALGVSIAAMTYDSREQLADFHQRNGLRFPLLQDIDAKHVNAFGIRNKDYKPGDEGYGVPHPGVIFINHAGLVERKFAYPGFRDRPSFDAIYAAIAAEQ